MPRKINLIILIITLTLVSLISLISISHAQEPTGREIEAQAALGTSFTYNDSLNNGGSPANGNFEFQFKLFDSASGGSQFDSTQTRTAVATNGQFSVKLDFGTSAFTGQTRFLEIAIRPAGSGAAFTTLSPRQELTAAPYALYSLSTG